MDRISELPLHIIHQIMSHLSRKEVAQTNLLSKTWKNHLLPSFPILSFNHEDFAGKGLPHYILERLHWERLFKRHPEKFIETIEGFTALVDATLDNFCKMKLSMQKFELHIGIQSNFEHWSCLINKWIELALENQVKNLDLAFLLFEKRLYPLPETVFSAESITRLSLCRCKLDHLSNTAADFRFHSLKILRLLDVSINEFMIHKLTTGSPLIEYFAIWNCWGFEHCHLPKLERLKTLVIGFSITLFEDQHLKSIQIEAPNLHHCIIDCYIVGPSSIKGLFNSQQMRKLILGGNLITDQSLADLFSKIFPLLEEFQVETSTILRRITIASQRLKQLKITRCIRLKAIQIDTPNLRGFFFIGYLAATASINAPCPGEFHLDSVREVDTLWYLKLNKFLNGNPKHESLSANIRPNKHSFNPEEYRRSSSSPPCELQKLHFQEVQMSESEYPALLDGFFSVCYPKILSCVTYHSLEFCRWLYYEVLTQKDAYRCDCSYVHCWRHYLKGIIQIKIEPPPPGEVVVVEPDALVKVGPDAFPAGLIEFALDWCFDVEKA